MNDLTKNTLKYVSDHKKGLTDDGCIIESSRDDKNVIKLIRGSKQIYLGSRYNVQRDIDNVMSKLQNINSQTLIIVFGLGTGEHIKSILHSLKFQNKILIIEPCAEVIKKFLKLNYSKYILQDKRIYLIYFQEDIKFLISNFINEINVYNLSIIIFPNYDRVFIRQYRKFVKCLKEIRNSVIVNLSTALKLSQRFFSSLVKNISYIPQSIAVNKLKKIYRDMPAIVVSSGPSLEKNMDQLKELQKYFIIISGLRNLKALIEIGVTPDFLCVIDSMEINYSFIKNYLNLNIPLLIYENSNSKVIENYKGPKILYVSNKQFCKLLGYDVDLLYQGGSVAHTCTSLAAYMGCNPIIFIGQDLAYTNDKLHADNTSNSSFNDISIKEGINKDYIWTENVHGNKVKTSEVFNSFRTRLEDFIKFHKDTEFVNSTEGGANIKGTKVLDLKTSGRIYKKSEKNREIVRDIVNDKNNRFDSEKIKKEVIENKKNLEDILKYIEKFKTDIDNLNLYYNGNRSVNINRIMSRLDKFDNFIKKNCDEFFLVNDLLNPVVLTVMSDKKFILLESDKEETKGKKIAAKYKILYDDIIKEINTALPMIEKSIKKF
ncbi:motility associated factor glycosyltransferase family protein [uncultured Clostridium sp.]|uniref:motility associated factor glycosyltransferase family protein n=1 Tax=uncultured Clostridium sp. TaxID=59620 RepID=UPI0025E3C259|nr:6-hydroxymethylpterin diphosphokinase MptE-like protein [uncultured Clostridium sp.]